MKTVALSLGKISATVSLDGAFVTQLTDGGEPILYEKRTITMSDGVSKTRGGMHVCLPHFGPGGSSGLKQHGFGRDRQWQVLESNDDYVSLILAGGGPGYESLISELTYQIMDDRSFTSTLVLSNTGKKSLRVAPAFHPYFYNNHEQVMVEADALYIDQLDPAVFRRNLNQLTLGDRNYSLATDKLNVWALWTDQMGEYVCLEPTLAGFSFEDHAASLPEEELQPHATRRYSFNFKWGDLQAPTS